MGVGLIKASPDSPDFWKQFQEHMQYTDEELENFKKDPAKVKMALKMADPEVKSKTLVFEVVEARGCGAGMRPGDRLFFQAGILLDPARSSNWCGYPLAYSAAMYAAVFQNLVFHGIDPSQMVHAVRDCGDATPKFGYGQTVFKVYVVDESKEKLPPQRTGVGPCLRLPGETEEQFFQRFKEHHLFTDEEFKRWLTPDKIKAELKFSSEENKNRTLVLEVVYSKGCIAGLRSGDKLYLRGGTFIDVSRSSPWCAYALSFATAQLGLGFQNLVFNDVDPREGMYVKYLSCGDCGPEFGGWGKIIYKIYTIEEKE